MYVYIDSTNSIEAITPNRLAARGGFTELEIDSDLIKLTSNNQYLVYSGGTVQRREHTDDEIATQTAERVASPSSYATHRMLAYPSLEEQADMQFHDAVNGTTVWRDTIQAVKDASPKP